MINLKKHDNVADAVQEVLEGKLHPNQQKLDVHEPEKDELTAKDFKMLRAKKPVKEELKGGQKNIDKNHNGKIDGQDFKILRGQKKANEEVKDEYARKVDKYLKKKYNKEETEQIDELSKSTLGSYAKKSTDDATYHSFSAGTRSAKDPERLKDDEKAMKRQSGVNKAIDRLTKEEVEVVYEANIQPTSAKSRSHIGNLSNPVVNSVKHSGKEIGLITKQPSGEYHAHHSAAKLAHAQSDTFDTRDKAHQFIRDAHAKAIKNGTLKAPGVQKEETGDKKMKTLNQFREGFKEMLADVKKRSEPQPNGGSGIKQGSRYGGGKQKSTPDQEAEKNEKKK